MSRITRAALRAFSLLALLLQVGCAVSPSALLFNLTGEEEAAGQVRGLLMLAGNLRHVQPRTAPYAPVAHTGLNPFGINVFLEQEVEAWKREKTVRMVAEAGFHWIRQGFPWEDIEIHGRGDYEDRRHEPHRSAWEKYDQIVSLANEYGLEIIARLSNPPDWSRADGDARGPMAPPDDLSDFGNYVYAVVSRYRGHIRYYQIWNEPNIYPEWGEQAVDPEGYTRLLCEAYRRAKEADPDAVIISGALAQTIALGERDLSDLVFLQRMYDAGAADCFDVLAVNDYLLWSAPTDRRLSPLLYVDYPRPVYLRDIMVANGDASAPIWLSEMNANAVPDDPSIQGWGAYGQVTLEQQARYAPLAYQRAMEEWPWVGVVSFWFFRRASDEERNQSWYYFRMVEPDFTPLPVYEAMRQYIASVTPTLYPGTHQEGHWGLAYEGAWESVEDERAVLGAYRRSTQGGATVAFSFVGNSLSLTPGPGRGEAEVVVDGRPARRVRLTGAPLRLFWGWTEARHQARITVVAGEVGVDSLTVGAPEWHVWVGRVALGGVGAAFVWFALRRRSRRPSAAAG